MAADLDSLNAQTISKSTLNDAQIHEQIAALGPRWSIDGDNSKLELKGPWGWPSGRRGRPRDADRRRDEPSSDDPHGISGHDAHDPHPRQECDHDDRLRVGRAARGLAAPQRLVAWPTGCSRSSERTWPPRRAHRRGRRAALSARARASSRGRIRRGVAPSRGRRAAQLGDRRRHRRRCRARARRASHVVRAARIRRAADGVAAALAADIVCIYDATPIRARELRPRHARQRARSKRDRSGSRRAVTDEPRGRPRSRPASSTAASWTS